DRVRQVLFLVRLHGRTAHEDLRQAEHPQPTQLFHREPPLIPASWGTPRVASMLSTLRSSAASCDSLLPFTSPMTFPSRSRSSVYGTEGISSVRASPCGPSCITGSVSLIFFAHKC